MATEKEKQLYYSHINSLDNAKELLVERDKEYFAILNENDDLKESIKELEYFKKKYEVLKSIMDKKVETKDLSNIEICSSKIFTTVLDYTDFDEDEEDEIEYFKIPQKEIANELLIDNGYAVCELKVRVHLEIIK